MSTRQFRKSTMALAAFLCVAFSGSVAFAQPADYETHEYDTMGSLDLINASTAYDAGFTGAGIVIGIMDTPVNSAHSDLAGKTLIFRGLDDDGTLAAWPETESDWAYQSHGTHVASIAAGKKDGNLMHGVAFDSTLAAQHLLPSGYHDLYGVDPAFWEIENLRVINNSWSPNLIATVDNLDTYGFIATDKDNREPLTGVDKLADPVDDIRTSLETNVNTRALVNWARTEKGKNAVIVFAAANNAYPAPSVMGLAPRYYGSDLSNWINVVSADNRYTHLQDGKISIESGGLPSTTNLAQGAQLFTVMAPGNWINAADAATGELCIKGGTSMAAPHVSGTVALVAQAFPWMNGRQLADTVLSTANSNIVLPDVMVGFTSQPYTQASFFVLNHNLLDNEGKLTKEVMQKYLTEAYEKMPGEFDLRDLSSLLEDFTDPTDNTFVQIYAINPEDVYGQGFLDAGKAVGGLARLDVNRYSKDAVTSIAELSDTQYAMETLNVVGPHSVFSNDISERLWDDKWHQQLFKYYGEDGNTTQNTLYNDDAKALFGKHAGIIKTGSGSLELQGTNTYEGPTVVENGLLVIAKRDDQTGGELTQSTVIVRKEGSLAGDGYIHQKLLNTGYVLPGGLQGSANPLHVGEFEQTRDGTLAFVLANDGTHNQLLVDRSAKVRGTLSIHLTPGFYVNAFTSANQAESLIVLASASSPTTRVATEASGLDIRFNKIVWALPESPTLDIDFTTVDDTSFTVSVLRQEDTYLKYAATPEEQQVAQNLYRIASDTTNAGEALQSMIAALDFSDTSGSLVRNVIGEMQPKSFA
ncbi:MAG: S8 family serine peptidase, partial [Sutterellaceae bacterium]|nr:S8 family serine peptidase [Sutterellaceae bacterium]